ncbi:MAG TPA: hypothetical protein VGH71_03805 [Gammaproteobacteria bacterium]|jgi:hypothetical protein
MNAHGHDLDPHFLLPLWQALVGYFRAHPPLVQGPQQLELPLPARAKPARRHKARVYPQLPRHLERRLPLQPSP